MTDNSGRQSICLTMIVRDEAHIVGDVLDATAPYIDYWVVVDTGSADGTEGFFARASTFNPTLYVRESMCSSDASERVCVLGAVAGSGGTATLNAMTASTTTGYLFIDNGASRGRYSVDYTP